jgi:multidrug efflux pump subunit AcrA (membrane-fusion protein)
MIGFHRSGVVALGFAVALGGCRGRGPRHASLEATATVTLTPRALAVTGVTTEPAATATVPETFPTTGQIEFDPSRVVGANAPVTGRLQRLTVGVGDRVAAGDTLAVVQSPEFLSGFAAITAPRSGVITTLSAAPQQLVTAGTELLRIAAIDRVWLRVDLYGDYARLGHVGVPVEVRVASFPEAVWKARIAAMAPSVEGATQAVTARVFIDNPDHRLLPGMFADVHVETGGSVRGILVPREAVIQDGGRQLVMIRQGTAERPSFFPSIVTLGPVVGDRVAVLRGVTPGEQVVVKGAYELYSAGYAFARGAEEE